MQDFDEKSFKQSAIGDIERFNITQSNYQIYRVLTQKVILKPFFLFQNLSLVFAVIWEFFYIFAAYCTKQI